MSNEIWLPINGFDDYLISDRGRVKSLKYDKILKPARSGRRRNYLQVVLYRKDGSKYRPKVHRLVAEHFIPNPLNLPQVNHKNMDTFDNSVENLEWCDNTHNQRERRRLHDGKIKGMKEARDIREEWSRWAGTKESFCVDAAERHGVSRNNIRFIIDGKTWKEGGSACDEGSEILQSATTPA